MQTNYNRSYSNDEFSAENDITSDDKETDDKVSCHTEEYEDNNCMNDDIRTMTMKKLMLNQWMKNQVMFLTSSDITKI